MYGKWMCFLVLDLVIIAYSTPGQFYLDFNSGNDKSIWGKAWRGWGHDWYSGYTTQRAKTKVNTTVSRRASRRSSTTPQPTISDVEIRLGEVITTTDAPSLKFIQAEQGKNTLEPFAPRTEDGETSVAAASLKTMPDDSSSQFVKAEAIADQKTLQAFASGPEDTETSTAKTMPDAPSSQFVKVAAFADQQALQAFARGSEDKETSVAASVKTMPNAPSSQFGKTEAFADQKTLQAFAPAPEDGETSVAVASIKTMSDDLKSQFVKTDAATVKPEASGLEAKPDRNTSLWHVAVYKLRIDTSGRSECCDLVCGGSLVKEYLVVSAGHCFWSMFDGVPRVFESAEFRMAAGKVHPGYNDPRDTGAQYSDVEMITMTEMERPCNQPDLAVVTLATPFKYTDVVKPVCVNFFWEDEQQLKKGRFGTVASWTLRGGGKCLPMPSESLFWLSLPFVEPDVCQVKTLWKTIGRDRICAGELNNTINCDRDGGNGLVFYQDTVPYLRGVTTDTYTDQDRCTEFNTRSFSDIEIPLHRLLIKIYEYASLEKCEDIYRTNVTKTAVTDDYDDGESGQQFGIQAIGADPVPALEGTRAPAYQWHVGVYSKAWTPFMQICGGTLVKRDFVISAAHCFWDDTAGQQPASQFAVAAGKLFRPWNNTRDTSAQHSDVSRIILPVRFRGAATSFQEDIAILRLSSPFTYTPGVQPACLRFNATFERMQLKRDWRGTVLGWGLTEENGRPSQRLNYLDLPYVDVEDCFTESEPAFIKFITSDKICAGDTISGYALCRGDSGGGYIFLSDGTPYFHGVASTAAGNQDLCNAFAIAAITSTYSHRGFIRENIPDIEEECAGDKAGTGNEGALNRESGKEASTGNAGLIGNVGTRNEGSMGHAALVENIRTENVGLTGNVGTGNQGLNVIGGTLGNAVGATPVFSQLPYYPNYFVCNCNCKT